MSFVEKEKIYWWGYERLTVGIGDYFGGGVGVVWVYLDVNKSCDIFGDFEL